ncbi:transcription factor MYB59-like [Telopea speciosissima]|uniref:transcription factor MYB59-like n=1 Tax=Telopea speciosissima TaxID=54955 RepID=UPI001CC58935|nr:transcription factor MYB59-like [Telopea speciosissima]
MVMAPEETRKGPWTEQDDLQLMCFVSLFGDRRWDSIAKVSGLNRTGKSCRLRWVNYLHPGLKRGRMTPQEERLVLELHSQWGNRWSRIARRLPGRTDNEIKNYWRTHMRKKAQERKRGICRPPSSSSSNSLSPTSQDSTSVVTNSLAESHLMMEGSLHENGVNINSTTDGDLDLEEVAKGYYSMDEIWKDIDQLMEEDVSSGSGGQVYDEGDNQQGRKEEEDGMCSSSFSLCPQTPLMASPPSWNYCSDSLWRMDDQENIKIWLPIINDHFVSKY